MKQAWQHSRFVAALRDASDSIAGAAAHSRTREAIDTLAGWSSESTLSQWLTRQSSPVAVDLRNTHTLGPLLRVFGWLRTPLAETSVADTARGWEQAGWQVLQRRPIAAVSLVVLVALVTNTLVTLALDGLTSVDVGLRLVAIAPFLLGTRSRATGDDIRESVLGRLFDPRTHRDDENE